MKRHSTDAAARSAPQQAELALRQGLALAMNDISEGRAELRDAAAGFAALGDRRGQRLAASALVVFIGIADDNYTGFEAAAAMLTHRREGSGKENSFADPADALLAEAGALTAGSFMALDAPELAARAAAIAQSLADTRIAAPLRCCAGLAALGYHHITMDLACVLWLELAMRPLLADAAVGPRLADEAFHMVVQSLYQCEAPERAVALRQRREQASPAPQPAIVLKLALLDAQMALGVGQADAGRQALDRAEPLLSPGAPRAAGWWHLLRSRLDLLEGRQRQALVHARLALRLASESHLPERWMGVTVMQEGHVLMSRGEPLQALPFFERAGRAASGSQARFCWCLAHLARALHHAGHDEPAAAREQLALGLAHARELAWLNFFRATPAVAAAVCALALEQGIESDFAREVIAERGLQAGRADLAEWPWAIRVRCFGGLRIEIGGELLAFRGKVAKKPLELMLFIIASGGADVSVATVAFALWRELDGDKARAALNAALFRLRKLLGDEDAVLLEHGRLGLNSKAVWVDALAFEQLSDSLGLPAAAAPAALSVVARAAATRALALYRDAFLNDSEDAAWQLVHRSRLASKLKRLVALLARDAVARGDSASARRVLERGLELDPLAEDSARELMRLLADTGEQAAALEVFARWRAAAERGLGAKAAPATLALVEHIRGLR